ncbi:hypothetical protein [Actinomadura sp. WMMA1423]|uniref:hypothetical protein n=1 Tax=Actinomadura sp. WMMA1423 TaxID=2591108 RepID=UPI001146F7C4|nr:hypothetical protein [Actinomadura sp. WMMA1423]
MTTSNPPNDVGGRSGPIPADRVILELIEQASQSLADAEGARQMTGTQLTRGREIADRFAVIARGGAEYEEWGAVNHAAALLSTRLKRAARTAERIRQEARDLADEAERVSERCGTELSISGRAPKQDALEARKTALRAWAVADETMTAAHAMLVALLEQHLALLKGPGMAA